MLRDTLATKAYTARTLAQSGIFSRERPDRTARALVALRRWGATPAAGYAASAIRFPDIAAIVDDRGSLTFADVHRRTNAIAHEWNAAGLTAGDGVAILCRNHRGLIEAMVACAKIGADALLLNTSLAGPQLAEICAREDPRAIVYDEEFEPLMAASVRGRKRYVGWTDRDRSEGRGGSVPRLDALAESGATTELPPPAKPGRIVILTSGTTGAPRGAIRARPESLEPVAALLSRMPLRARERTLIAVPLFHVWGLTHVLVGTALASTLVLRRRFDPEETLRAIDEHGATALVVVPVMLQRILELGPRAIGRHDLGALRVIASSGSALPGPLASRATDVFGDVLYNLYGSTEVAWATIATPADLRAAPGTAGLPPRGTEVRLYDADDREVAEPGARGRIHVRSDLVFAGYTEGAGRPVVDGFMSTGDIGFFDNAGRLFVEGREDEMIVSGGENVLPGDPLALD